MQKKERLESKKLYKIAASCILLAVFLCFSLRGSGDIHIGRANQEDMEEHSELSPSMSDTTAPGKEEGEITGSEPEQENDIFVDVSGCVVRPGVYQLPPGSRIFEAVELAGGMTPEADRRSVNLAAVLQDEQKVVILSAEEFQEAEDALAESGATGERRTDGRININTADLNTLQSLSGIGPSMAQRILDYRSQNGTFRSVEDLMKVSGIGQKTFDKLRDHICIE